MTSGSTNSKADNAVNVPGAILFVLNILAVLFSGCMLLWAIQELNYQGERWGLLGVLFLGSPAMLVEGVFLLLTILLVTRNKTLTLRFRALVLMVIVTAVLLNVAALACVFYSPSQHEQEFIGNSAFYQSGLREAVVTMDVRLSQDILEKNPGLISETDYHGNNSLLLAAKAGDTPMVGMLLKHRANPNTHDFDDTTPLHLSAARGDVEIAKLLLAGGARLNAKDRHGKTPLFYADASGNEVMMTLLVSQGGKTADY